MREQIDQRVKVMYEEYKQATADGTRAQVPDDVKVSLMRDTFSMMMGDQFVNTE